MVGQYHSFIILRSFYTERPFLSILVDVCDFRFDILSNVFLDISPVFWLIWILCIFRFNTIFCVSMHLFSQRENYG